MPALRQAISLDHLVVAVLLGGMLLFIWYIGGGAGTIKKKPKRKPHRNITKELAQAQLKRKAELDVEARFSQDYVLVEGQLFHKRHLNKIIDEWQERRIIY